MTLFEKESWWLLGHKKNGKKNHTREKWNSKGI
jgi:hypothetical protein